MSRTCRHISEAAQTKEFKDAIAGSSLHDRVHEHTGYDN